MSLIPFVSGGGRGTKNAAANTRVQCVVGGEGGFFTHIVNIRFTTLGDAHTVTMMRSASRSVVNGAMAAACTALVSTAQLLDGDGNNAAASDYLAVRLDDGNWHSSNISAYNTTTFVATLTTAIPTGRSVLDQAQVVCYGAAGDTYHANYQLATTVNTTFNWPVITGEAVSMVKNVARGEPIAIDSPNANTVGTLNFANYALSVL